MSETRTVTCSTTFHNAPKTLVLPPLSFAPLPTFSMTKKEHFIHPSPFAFPPLFGLNLKFGNGNPLTFSRSKIDFSVDSNIASTPHKIASSISSLSCSNNLQFAEIKTKDIKPPSLIKNRGRPSADSIHMLKQKSIENPYRYKCPECSRSFPRKKSLDTHRLTHSDVKPYACDFPGCKRKFKQSGQLKTHVRLHTGEKPFQCTFPLCNISFTHANRKCPNHPEYPLQRILNKIMSPLNGVLSSVTDSENTHSEQVKAWLQKQCSNSVKSENVLKPIENIGNHENNKTLDKSSSKSFPISEENDRRLLSAVALVEMRDQMKSSKQENYNYLFNTTK
ncbi:zinc finger protein 367-like [Hydractinia symbiolongicarpus]|uniref:zinc finger protein 367-like n=1 Tax=Hydractinia symbiolongicarpus TaxID=13093 RepID=UPI00254D1E43|nr:zinc finger protein 367-like [Hydractinia symbiolongicarpus]